MLIHKILMSSLLVEISVKTAFARKYPIILKLYLRGFTPEDMISSYELEVMARTCTSILKSVLGPCAQCCPCKALEQKRPKISKPKRKEMSRPNFCLSYGTNLANIFGGLTQKSDSISISGISFCNP